MPKSADPAETVVDLDGRALADAARLERVSFRRPWSEADLARTLAAGAVGRLLRRGGEPVAYLLAHVVREEAELVRIAVAPDRRGRGVGRRLLAGALDAWADAGVREVWLEVRESNVPARSMYEALGFVAAGRRGNYFDAPVEDAIVFRRGAVREERT